MILPRQARATTKQSLFFRPAVLLDADALRLLGVSVLVRFCDGRLLCSNLRLRNETVKCSFKSNFWNFQDSRLRSMLANDRVQSRKCCCDRFKTGAAAADFAPGSPTAGGRSPRSPEKTAPPPCASPHPPAPSGALPHPERHPDPEKERFA